MSDVNKTTDPAAWLRQHAALRRAMDGGGFNTDQMEAAADEIERLRRRLHEIATMAEWHPDGATVNYAVNAAREALK